MSLVISFLNQKGGVGKSTLSINVAACFALLGQKVLLIDADKQGTSSTWASLRPETAFQVVSMARENMARDALKLAADFDFTIIDGPPQAETISRSCIVASDLVVVPIEPGGASRWSSDLTVRQLKEAQELKPTLKCGFVVSRKIGATVLGRDTRIDGRRCGHSRSSKPKLNSASPMPKLSRWARPSLSGRRRGPAVSDIQALTHELLDVLNEQNIRTSPEAKAAIG